MYESEPLVMQDAGTVVLVLFGLLLLAVIAIGVGKTRNHAEQDLLRILSVASILLPILWPFAMAFALFGKTNDD